MTASTRELPRTLGLGDLVLAQVLIVIGLNCLGPAARLGGLHWVYWLLGIAAFHLPLAAVVTHLNRRMPLEGGLYQWAKDAFGARVGFLMAWNFMMFVVIFVSMLGLSFSTALGYATGASEAAMNDPLTQIAMSVVVTALLVGLSIVGFGTSKWLHNLSSASLLLTGLVLIAIPWMSPATHVAQTPIAFSAMQLVLFTRVAVYALAGYECMAVVAGECRDPSRTIPRSIAIAVPLIALVYILGTQSVLTFVRSEAVDLVNPVAQTFAIALHPSAATAAILLLVLRDFAQSSQVFAAATRLPLVAGWDALLPPRFTRLHPRFQTPVLSILVAGGVTLVSAFAAIAAASRQESFQILLSIAGLLFATTYLVMFAIPLLRPAPAWLRVAALSGFLATLAFVVLAFVPIVEVRSPLRYALIVAAAVAAVEGVGFAAAWKPV